MGDIIGRSPTNHVVGSVAKSVNPAATRTTVTRARETARACLAQPPGCSYNLTRTKLTCTKVRSPVLRSGMWRPGPPGTSMISRWDQHESTFKLGGFYSGFDIEMLFEVEVSPDGNSPMELNRVFDLLGDPQPVSRIFTADLKGEDRWCDVTGWSDQGQCPAYAARAEDSGDGVILLVYGGNQGIRLRPADLADPWALENPGQWGEPCLMLPAEARYEVID